jgi:hypothetical protein
VDRILIPKRKRKIQKRLIEIMLLLIICFMFVPHIPTSILYSFWQQSFLILWKFFISLLLHKYRIEGEVVKIGFRMISLILTDISKL